MNNEFLDSQEPEPQAAPVAPGGAARSSTARAGVQFSRGNLVLVALLVGGLAVVYAMSLREGPGEASAEQRAAQLQVDSALTVLNASGASAEAQRVKAETVVKEFYHDTRQRQVPLSGLRKNPCVFVMPEGTAPVIREGPKQPAAPRRPLGASEAEREAQRMLKAAGALQLQSVMTGAHGATAMISNNLLTEGSEIEGWTIQSIGGTEVVLAWNDRTYTLRLPR